MTTPLTLPPDVAYCLDSAVETGDITGDVRLYFSSMEPDAATWFDGLDKFMSEMSFADCATNRMVEWRETADPIDAAGVSWAGLTGMPWRIEETARAVAGYAYSREQDGEPIALDEACGDEMRRLTLGWPGLIDRARQDIGHLGRDHFVGARDHIAQLMRRAMARRNRELEELRERLRRDRGLYVSDHRSQKRIRKAIRKPITKSVRLLQQVIGGDQARAWVRGGDFVVEGRQFNFRSRLNRIGAVGHGGIDITVTDKDNVELVDLCLYWRDTPAADQLAALVFSVQAGEEDGILETANVIRVHASAAARPAFRLLRDGAVARRHEEAAQANQLRIPRPDGEDIVIDVPAAPDATPRWRALRDDARAILLAEVRARDDIAALSAEVAFLPPPEMAAIEFHR